MVESKEIAVLFRREVIKKENCEYYEFIPIKIIEGNYNEDDNLFIDRYGDTHPHIGDEFYTSGNCYGGRIKNNTDKNIVEERKKILQSFKSQRYYRSILGGEVKTINKRTGEKSTFRDKDNTPLKNPKFQEQIGSSFQHPQNPYSISTSNPIISMNSYKQQSQEQDRLKVPKDIVNQLKGSVIGQDEAIKTIVTTIYMNLKYPNIKKNNMLVVGPTGVGKTFIFEELSKILDIPLTIYSIPGTSQTGYVGKSIEDILSSIIINSNYDLEKAKRSIVILDEIDKIAYQNTMNSNISTEGVQNELLKLIEGTTQHVTIDKKDYAIDTSNITFVGLGAFQEIYNENSTNKPTIGFNQSKDNPTKLDKITPDDISKYGIKKELIGRLPILVELNNLTKEDLKNIILNSNSEFGKIIALIKAAGIEVSNIDFLCDLVANNAIEKHLGARGINQVISKIFINILYDIMNNPELYGKLIIGENILENPMDYSLIKKGKSRVLKQKQEIGL